MSDSLKINLMILPEEGLKIAFSPDDEWLHRQLPVEELPDFSLAGADVRCHITRSGDTIYIRGELAAQISQECSRCLEPATVAIGGDFAYTMLPAKPQTAPDLELTTEELETGYYSGDFIDLAPIVCEQIVLQAPMKVLCRQECRGLCPHCGTNLNTVSCNCREEAIDARLAVLKNFKVKKKETKRG